MPKGQTPKCHWSMVNSPDKDSETCTQLPN